MRRRWRCNASGHLNEFYRKKHLRAISFRPSARSINSAQRKRRTPIARPPPGSSLERSSLSVIVIVVVIVPVQVLNAFLISAPVAAPVSFSILTSVVRMPVFLPIMHVRWTMIFRISTSAFYAVVKSLSLYSLQFTRRLRPLFVAIARRRWLLYRTCHRNCDEGCCG